jgi:hypothetical protein
VTATLVNIEQGRCTALRLYWQQQGLEAAQIQRRKGVFMADSKITVTVAKGVMTITIPMQKAAPSSSGKSMVVATTSGNITTDCIIDGKPVVLGLNAYYKP